MRFMALTAESIKIKVIRDMTCNRCIYMDVSEEPAVSIFTRWMIRFEAFTSTLLGRDASYFDT
jgi:hypothetical protein